jgi:hypothetical protein
MTEQKLKETIADARREQLAERESKAPLPTKESPQARYLTDHKVNPANDTLTIAVTDMPGAGGANHQYEISGFNPGDNIVTGYTWNTALVLLFQNGPIAEAGVNGITHEVLLAIVADRLRSFQKGPYASRHNALALTAIEEAQNWLNRRTLERVARGVEGTHKL